MRLEATASATVANLGPGFDVLGLCLEGPLDRVIAELTTTGRAEIVSITGDDGRLSIEAAKNCAGVAAQAVLDRFGDGRTGVRMWLDKGLPLGSGLGSSAASSVAAAVATAGLLDPNLPKEMLFDCTREGERLATGSPHPDNVAPSLFGGCVACLAGDGERVDVVTLPVPEGLMVVVVKPAFEVHTADARAILPREIPIGDAVANLGAMAALVKSFMSGDLRLLGRALEDRIATPYRKRLIPGFDAVTLAAQQAGALGTGISGAGPALFALCPERDAALDVADAMVEAFERSGSKAQAFVCAIDRHGAHIR